MTREEVVKGLLEHPELAVLMSLTPLQKMLYDYIRSAKMVSGVDIVREFNLNYASASIIIKKLKIKGFIVECDNEHRTTSTKFYTTRT